MSTYTFSNRTVQSDGITTKIVNNGVEQTFTPNRYTVSTPLTDTTYTNGNFHQYAETRNIDVSGNSQENYAGRGVTSEYNVKIVGSPDMFSGNAQRGADKALSQLVGVLLQQGDDRNFAPGNPMGEIDLKSVTSSMASSWQTSMCPTLSPIRELSDIPMVLGEIVAWGEGIKIADAAEQAELPEDAMIHADYLVPGSSDYLKAVATILRDVDNNDLALALKGGNEQVQAAVFNNMSKRLAVMIKEDMEFMGPVRMKDVEEAQQKIVNIIRKLEDSGEIVISRGGGDEIVV